MGLFNFVKHIGEKLGVITDGQDHEQHSNMLQEALQNSLRHYQQGNDRLDVKVDGEHATLRGNVEDNANLEKAILAIGNAMGISSVDTNNVTVNNLDTEKTPSEFYQVKQGDNLWKIAEKIYGAGHGDKNTEIFHANQPMLSSPDKIYPGQVLRIPTSG